MSLERRTPATTLNLSDRFGPLSTHSRKRSSLKWLASQIFGPFSHPDLGQLTTAMTESANEPIITSQLGPNSKFLWPESLLRRRFTRRQRCLGSHDSILAWHSPRSFWVWSSYRALIKASSISRARPRQLRLAAKTCWSIEPLPSETCQGLQSKLWPLFLYEGSL
jgi:hypothetical protein